MTTPPIDYREPAPGVRRRLYRSRKSRVIAGVAGGLAEYFDLDPVLLRVALTAVLIFTAIIPATIFYVACILIIPAEPAG